MNDDADLIPVFIPALGAVLIAAEDEKGQPLTNDEVLSIRDNAACIKMTHADAAKLIESRGYDDLDRKTVGTTGRCFVANLTGNQIWTPVLASKCSAQPTLRIWNALPMHVLRSMIFVR